MNRYEADVGKTSVLHAIAFVGSLASCLFLSTVALSICTPDLFLMSFANEIRNYKWYALARNCLADSVIFFVIVYVINRFLSVPRPKFLVYTWPIFLLFLFPIGSYEFGVQNGYRGASRYLFGARQFANGLSAAVFGLWTIHVVFFTSITGRENKSDSDSTRVGVGSKNSVEGLER